MKMHEQAQQGKRPAKTFQCVKCKSTFHTNTKLKLHTKTEHLGEEKPESAPMSPPLSPEHKKKKKCEVEENLNEGKDTNNKKDMPKEEDKDKHEQCQIHLKSLNTKLTEVESENKVLKTENTLCKTQLTEWKTYGENLHKKFVAIKTSYAKLEEENEKLGAKYIETVKELSQHKEIEIEEYSLNCEDENKNKEDDNDSEDEDSDFSKREKYIQCEDTVNFYEKQEHMANCCVIRGYSECEFESSSLFESEKHKDTKHKADYNCKNCGESLNSYKDLMNHRRDNHVKRKPCRYFLIDKCNFDKDICWYLHSENIEAKKICNFCDNTFTTKNDLMKHIKDNHNDNLRVCKNMDRCEYKTNCWFKHEQ